MAYIGNFPAEKYTTFSKQTFTPDGSTTSFTLDFSVANENDLELFVNNVRQEPGSGKAYTATGLTLTMSSAPGASDDMYAIFQGKAQQTVTPGPQTVTGSMLATDIAISTSGNITTTGNITGTLATAAQPNITSLGTLTGLTTGGDISFVDGVKALFGTGSDLQIFHTGSNSVITDTGTGNLIVRANDLRIQSYALENTYINASEGGSVDLYYNNSLKLATTSTGVDVTGTTSTSSGFLNTVNNSQLTFGGGNATNEGANLTMYGGSELTDPGAFRFRNGTTLTSKITADGQHLAYPLGPTTPSFSFTNDTNTGMTRPTTDTLTLVTNSSERVRINSDGQILINDTSATTVGAKFEVNGSSYFRKDHTSGVPSGNISNLNYNHALVLANRNGSSDTNISSLGFDVTTSSAVSNGAITFESTASGTGDFAFYLETGNTIYERMRITSAGHVLIGQTSPSTTDDGHYLQSSGTAIHVANSNRSLDLYRLSDNGDTLQMYQGSTICGRMGTYSSNAMYISAPNNGGGGFLFTNNASTIYPTRRTSGTVSLSDNTNDLGAQVWRFNDAYITNGVTTGSDQNEKQQIQLLTDSEIAVAKRISKGFKTFKWNSAVEEKGDNARIHTGVIAQDVQQAFADEGLDAGNYAFFMSNTYWEKEISVDAVAEELDEEGNVIVEGKDAYTYIDKKEEATEGYTERTRLGIRYPELLSFVSSAFEQRLTNIETRLTALET